MQDDVTETIKKSIRREEWMGVTKLVRAKGYKSELMRKYGSIKAFCIVADVPYNTFNNFLNGRGYWRKSFEKVCEEYLYGDKKFLLPDLAYKNEIDRMRSEIRLLFGSAKALCTEFHVSKPTTVYSLLNKWGKSRRKGVSYWIIKWAIAEKKLQILKAAKDEKKDQPPLHPDAR